MPLLRLPRIYYAHPWLFGPIAEWGPSLDGIAAMGFDHVLIAPPFASAGSVFLASDVEQAHPALGGGPIGSAVETLAALCAARGVSLLVDLQLDRIAAKADLAAAEPGWFMRRSSDADPRVPAEERGAVFFRYDRREVLQAGLDLWSGVVRKLVESGVAGFRIEGLANLPTELLRALIGRTAGGASFIAATPGAGWDTIDRLAGSGFDAVIASTPWWDFRSPWLLAEREHLNRIAPVIAMPEAPFGRRRAAGASPAEAQAAAKRALWFAATEADGLLMPLGFEFGAEDTMDSARGSPDDLAWSRRTDGVDLREAVTAANASVASRGGAFVGGPLRPLSAPGADVIAWLRTSGEPGEAGRGRLILVNARLDQPSTFFPERALPGAGGAFGRFAATIPDTGEALVPGDPVRLAPGEVRVWEAGAAAPIVLPVPKPDRDGVPAPMRRPRIVIEAVTPAVEAGRFAVKRTVGETVRVEADIFADGHDVLAAVILYRAADEKTFREAPMQLVANDRWAGEFPLERMGRHVFAVEAWRDGWATYRSELSKKHVAGVPVSLEIEEGRRMLAGRAGAKAGAQAGLPRLAELIGGGGPDEQIAVLLSDAARTAMRAADPRDFATRTDVPYPVDAERLAARFSSWYELFPRSQSGDPSRHGTFDDVIARLPSIAAMGFDTLYFPPIHPIGLSNRKGRNNTLGAGADQPGSPYAIGSGEGGHDAVHPELGTLDDFRRLVAAARRHGMELALDFAIQCSPDHPWLKDHPDWFNWRPDGSIRYAENPPKKYEDIVNVDFYAPAALPALWLTLRDVVLFWAENGVRVFRVDNPHTKPLPFWEWMIGDVRGRYPDMIFLAEAFTRPKMMYRLAKIGFPQSYTYFTWRTEKRELTDYLEELETQAPREFFRPHFFVNTPDINPVFLQNSGRPGFLIRAALATTLSGLWGMYNGFELCEGRSLPGKEEYLDSEKFEIVAWDHDRPGNIKAEIGRLNAVRKANPALQTHLGVRFYTAYNDRILFYGKRTPDLANFILVAVNLDPFSTQEAGIEVPLWEFGLPDDGALAVEDLMNDRSFIWRGKNQFLRLDPNQQPFVVFRIRPA